MQPGFLDAVLHAGVNVCILEKQLLLASTIKAREKLMRMS